MTWIETHLIREALSEFADADYQTRIWLATEGEVGSPIEAFSQLFDDSGLGNALDSDGPVFSSDIDQQFVSLETSLKALTAEQRPPLEVLEDNALVSIRSMAALVLYALVRHEAEESRQQ